MDLNRASDESGEPSQHVIARDRVKSLPELAEISRQARAENKKVVLAHGVFDLLHLGHVRHLEAARKLGDILIVTVTADKYVRKGPGRPVFPQGIRAEMLAALGYIDWTGI
ncbi:MAG: cytidyltransferase, partial [Euryarchaeota archaeon]|nr:cytidyltransferase [Euryarchaeota archaeon]